MIFTVFITLQTKSLNISINSKINIFFKYKKKILNTRVNYCLKIKKCILI